MKIHFYSADGPGPCQWSLLLGVLVVTCVLSHFGPIRLFVNIMDCSSPGFSVCGDSSGKKAGVGCHALLQEIFLTQGSNNVTYVSCIGSWVLYCWCPLGSPVARIQFSYCCSLTSVSGWEPNSCFKLLQAWGHRRSSQSVFLNIVFINPCKEPF